MASELNHDTIKSAIVTILQANTSLYTTTGQSGELRSIEVGFPPGDNLQDKAPPYAFITNSDAPFETTNKIGSVSNNQIIALQHVFHYDITVVVNQKDSRTAEEQLDNFQELILETLEADYDLSDAVSESFPNRISKLRTSPFTEGRGFKGRVITIRCTKTTTGATSNLLGAIAEFVKNDNFALKVGSNSHIPMTIPSIAVGRTELRVATNDSGSDFKAGMSDNFFTTTLYFTDQITGLNTLTQTDSNGELTSTSWLLVATADDSTTQTFAATGVLRNYFVHPGPVGYVGIDIFVRITGDTVTIS